MTKYIPLKIKKIPKSKEKFYVLFDLEKNREKESGKNLTELISNLSKNPIGSKDMIRNFPNKDNEINRYRLIKNQEGRIVNCEVKPLNLFEYYFLFNPRLKNS